MEWPKVNEQAAADRDLSEDVISADADSHLVEPPRMTNPELVSRTKFSACAIPAERCAGRLMSDSSRSQHEILTSTE